MHKLVYILVMVCLLPLTYAEMYRAGPAAYEQIADKILSIDKFEMRKGEVATLNFHNTESDIIYNFCINGFAGHENQIELKSIKQVKKLWPDADLLSDATNINGVYCFGTFKNTVDTEISFSADYHGKGKIKYDIILIPVEYNYDFKKGMDDNQTIILDPYLIGDLAQDDKLLMHIPFDNNVSVKYSKETTAIDTSTLTTQTWQSYDYGATCSSNDYWDDWSALFDDDYATGTYCRYESPTYNSGRCTADYIFEKPASSTGAYFDVRIDSSRYNLTMPEDCLNYNSSHVMATVAVGSGACNCGGGEYIACIDNLGLEEIIDNLGCNAHLYEVQAVFTNESGYTAYQDANINASYWLKDNYAVAGYDFGVFRSLRDYFNGHDGTANSVSYSSMGVYTNAPGDNITLNDPILNNTATFTAYFRVMPTAITGAQYLASSYNNVDVSSSIQLFVRATGYLDGAIYNATGGSCIIPNDVGSKLYEYNWYDVVYQYNGTVFMTYLNGELNNYVACQINNYSNYNDMLLLSTAGTSNNVLFGYLEKAIFYNRSLSYNELASLYAGNYSDNKLNESNASVYFRGTNEHVITDLGLSGMTTFSISAWVRPGTTGTSQMLLDNRDGVNDGLVFFISNTMAPTLYINANKLISNTTIPSDAWTHLVVTRDQSNLTSVYINGSRTDQVPVSGTISVTNNITIGLNYALDAGWLSGGLDELFVYNYALSQGEVSTLYAGYDNQLASCSLGGDPFLNFSLKDEEKQSALSGTIQSSLTLRDPSGDEYNFSVNTTGSILAICTNNINITDAYYLDAITSYESDDYVTEYHYITNASLANMNIPQEIFLYDLNSSDSTSFLVTYQDENYIYIEGAIMDLQRKYIGSGTFISVEQAKTDSSGQTRLHLVTEDIIYKINVWVDNSLEYTSGDFFALCQASPCQINLRKDRDDNISSSILDNILYTVTNQPEFESSKIIEFNFSTVDGTSTNITLNVTKGTYANNETICYNSTASSSGSVSCNIPLIYQNASYSLKVYKDDEYIGQSVFYLNPSAKDTFGDLGVFMAGLGFLVLTLIGISAPPLAVLFGIVGLAGMGALAIFDGGSAFGIGSILIYLICAGAIIIYKILRLER